MNVFHNDVAEEDVIVRCRQGQLRGLGKAGVSQFMDIPYADDLLPEERFSLPRAPKSWQGLRDAQRAGAIFPQLPSRLDFVMGPREADVQQSENAFRLNIWTPSVDARLPVLFWIHGGGFLTGGGALSCYHGEELAHSGKVVVVTVNYRLGILGNLYQPGISQGNNSVHDLLAAFNWVYDNISAFGGDHLSITVGGQSAGAWYTQLMMAIPGISERIKRALLMSLPNVPPLGKNAALGLSESFCKFAEIDVAGRSLMTMSTSELLTTQTKLLRSQKVFADVPLTFMPVVDDIVPENIAAAAANLFSGKEILIGTTREEMSSFFASRPDLLAARKEMIIDCIRQRKGLAADHIYAAYEAARCINSPYTQLVDFMSDVMFRLSTIEFAEQLEKSEARTYVYEFNFNSPQSHVYACHCFDLPFFFHNFHHWKNAPMLELIPAQTREAISRAFYGSLLTFIKTGNPNAEKTENWPAYDRQHRMTMQFDQIISAVGDPARISLKRAESLSN